MSLKKLVILSVILLGVLMVSSCEPPEITSAKVYFQQDNPEKAEEQLEIAKTKYPANAQVYWLLATGIYSPKEEWEKTRDALLECKKIDPTYAKKVENELNRLGAQLYTQAAQTFNKAIPMTGLDEKEERVKILTQASRDFQLALQIKDNEPAYYKGIVNCFIMLTDTANVIKYAELAIDKNIFEESILAGYTDVLWTPGNEEETLYKLDQIIAEHPESMMLYNRKIRFLFELERFDDAKVLIEELIVDHPTDVDLKFNLAQLFMQQGEIEQAARWFEKVYIDAPEDIEVVARIAQCYFESKDFLMSEDYSRKLIDLAPEKAIGYEILWRTLFQQGRQDEALEFRAKAKELK